MFGVSIPTMPMHSLEDTNHSLDLFWNIVQRYGILLFMLNRGDRGWLSHGLVVTLPISYSLDGGTLWGFTRDMRIAD